LFFRPDLLGETEQNKQIWTKKTSKSGRKKQTNLDEKKTSKSGRKNKQIWTKKQVNLDEKTSKSG
jgi:hypothetical protein